MKTKFKIPEHLREKLNNKYGANNRYRTCVVENCNYAPRDRATGYCGRHLRRYKVFGDAYHGKKLRPAPKCKCKNCPRAAERLGYCLAHYQRILKGGKIRENDPIVVRNGWFQHNTGYIVVSSSGHSNGMKNGSIMEHIKIMSEYLGRSLLRSENVHHKNGIRYDNRIENLELWSTFQPKGQRVKDKIVWAKEILKIYSKDKKYV